MAMRLDDGNASGRWQCVWTMAMRLGEKLEVRNRTV